MKYIICLLIIGVYGQDCDLLTGSSSFLSITNALAKENCKRRVGAGCNIRCKNGFKLSNANAFVRATCACNDDQCGWSYGDDGSGELQSTPRFGCCRPPDRFYGTSWTKQLLARNFGKKYIEADDTYALIGLKVKIKNPATAGYSFILVFEDALPADLTFETFTRFVVQEIFVDSMYMKTFLLLTSNTGYDVLETGENFLVTFGVRSSGETSAKTFVENTRYKVRYYASRETSWCVGNPELSQMVQPKALFGTFNIQVFGVTKYGKLEVKNQIIEILRRYDIVTIQEIRDAGLQSFPGLVADMNAVEDKYDSVMGERQGSSSSKEQIGFIWDRTKFSLHRTYDFDDSATSWFERPPTIAYFNRLNANAKVKKIAIISAHIKPIAGASDMGTETEINHLEDVYNDAIVQEPEYSDVIIAGDFNADCTYVGEPETTLSMASDSSFEWVFDFDIDTTVSDTDCAYDHIILKGPNIKNAYSNPQVFNYQTFYDTDNIFYEGNPITKLVSDHFPVELWIH